MTIKEIKAFKKNELSWEGELRMYCQDELCDNPDNGLMISNTSIISAICDSVDWYVVWRESVDHVADIVDSDSESEDSETS